MTAWAFPARLEALAADSRLRERRSVASAQGAVIRVGDRDLLSFASNDYLGLANHPRLAAAAASGITDFGVGSGASHLVSGHTTAHDELEQHLAQFTGMPRALSFSSGYLANLAILTALADRHTAIFADKLNHACLNDGALLSRAELHRYAHLDLGSLAAQLSASNAPRKIIATDAVFSMDGDIAPLPELLKLAEAHDALLVVDDAHGFGVLGNSGRGTLEHFKVASPHLVYMATLGKAAGVAGAFVAGSSELIEVILQTARSYIFTTAQPALLARAACEALSVFAAEPQRRKRVLEHAAHFRKTAKFESWRLMPSHTPIQPVLIGGNAAALAAAKHLYDAGIWAPAIRPPTVPEGTARLRVSFSASHTVEHVDQLVSALAAAEGDGA